MNMKWLSSKKVFITLLGALLFVTTSQAQDTLYHKPDTIIIRDTVYLETKAPLVGYEKKAERIRSRWLHLVPTYNKVQFAGSMGLISTGTGWDYGKNNQWETDLLFGFVPKYSSGKNKLTMTLKQNFIPWSVRLNDRFNLKPLTTGLYLNTVFGGDFWGKEPSKYPNSYYKFSTKMRINVFMGQAWEFKLDTSKKVFCKSITFFYEISTNELYMISAANNKYLKASDFLGLSLGIKIQYL